MLHRTRRYTTEIAARTWQEAGVCRDADLGLFFGPANAMEGTAERRRRLLEAKRICEQCPVLAVCRRYALENGEKFGVWGGLSESERRRLRGARSR